MTRAKRVSAREGEWLRNGVFQQNILKTVVQGLFGDRQVLIWRGHSLLVGGD